MGLACMCPTQRPGALSASRCIMSSIGGAATVDRTNVDWEEDQPTFGQRSIPFQILVMKGTNCLGDDAIEASNPGNLVEHYLTLVR